MKVAVVAFQAGPLVEAYVRETDLTWPILVDDGLSLYQAYGMERGTWWNIWGPASVRVYLKLMARGRWPKRPAGDVSQLGGDVLIDPAGIVRLHHVGNGPADRPAVDAILGIVRQCAQHVRGMKKT